MESSVARMRRRRSCSVTEAVSAISSGERMQPVICFSRTGWGASEKNRCRALTIRLRIKACRGSKAVVSSVMATYCMLPQKAKALTKPDHRKP